MSKIKLLVCDLDNTLLSRDGSVSAKDIAAIRAFLVSGGIFTIATGRALGAFAMLRELVSLVGAPVITGNGGQICDAKTAEVLFQKVLPEESKPILDETMLRFPELGAVIYTGMDGFYRFRTNEYIDELIVREARSAIDCAPAEAPPAWNKILTAQTRPCLEAVKVFLDPRLEGVARTVFSEENFLEVLPLGVSKGSALREIIAHLGITMEEVAAVGDGFNDLEMVQCAGLGAAVGNAEPALLAAADVTLRRCGEDAIAQLVETYLL